MHDVQPLRTAYIVYIHRRCDEQHFPRVLVPQPCRADVRGYRAEAAVCYDVLPYPRRESVVYFKCEFRVVPAVFRNSVHVTAGTQLRFAQRVILLLRFPDDNSGAALHRFRSLKRRCEHAAGTAYERFQPDRCEHLPDVPQQRLEVFALLTREVNKLRVEPAAFEQAEAPQ